MSFAKFMAKKRAYGLRNAGPPSGVGSSGYTSERAPSLAAPSAVPSRGCVAEAGESMSEMLARLDAEEREVAEAKESCSSKNLATRQGRGIQPERNHDSEATSAESLEVMIARLDAEEAKEREAEWPRREVGAKNLGSEAANQGNDDGAYQQYLQERRERYAVAGEDLLDEGSAGHRGAEGRQKTTARTLAGGATGKRNPKRQAASTDQQPTVAQLLSGHDLLGNTDESGKDPVISQYEHEQQERLLAVAKESVAVDLSLVWDHAENDVVSSAGVKRSSGPREGFSAPVSRTPPSSPSASRELDADSEYQDAAVDSCRDGDAETAASLSRRNGVPGIVDANTHFGKLTMQKVRSKLKEMFVPEELGGMKFPQVKYALAGALDVIPGEVDSHQHEVEAIAREIWTPYYLQKYQEQMALALEKEDIVGLGELVRSAEERGLQEFALEVSKKAKKLEDLLKEREVQKTELLAASAVPAAVAEKALSRITAAAKAGDLLAIKNTIAEAKKLGVSKKDIARTHALAKDS